MTTTPGDESQDRPEDGTEETAPLPPGTQPEGWQPQWQPQYPGSGQPGGAPSGAPYAPTPQH